MAIERKDTTPKDSSREDNRPMNENNQPNQDAQQPEKKKGSRRSRAKAANANDAGTLPAGITTDGYEEKTMDGRRIVRFMKWRKPMGLLSFLLVLVSIGAIIMNGLNLGLDFTGGVSAEAVYEQPVNPQDVTAALEKAGFQTEKSSVQNLGTQRNVKIKIPPQEDEEGLAEKLKDAIQLPNNTAEIPNLDIVGSQVGEELYVSSIGALALALGCMMLYIAIRFQFKLAVGAVMALIHDVLIVIGIFAFFKWPFDFSVLAAVLALIGYSLNDTIVVFDRIRENFRRIRGISSEQIVDVSLTETLRRTIVTSVSTMIVVLCMFFLGGDGLKWFSTALLLGLIAGTYSSIYIASNFSLSMGLERSDFVVKVKPEFEEEVVDFE